jgi:hypothetical protein
VAGPPTAPEEEPDDDEDEDPAGAPSAAGAGFGTPSAPTVSGRYSKSVVNGSGSRQISGPEPGSPTGWIATVCPWPSGASCLATSESMFPETGMLGVARLSRVASAFCDSGSRCTSESTMVTGSPRAVRTRSSVRMSEPSSARCCAIVERSVSSSRLRAAGESCGAAVSATLLRNAASACSGSRSGRAVSRPYSPNSYPLRTVATPLSGQSDRRVLLYMPGAFRCDAA